MSTFSQVFAFILIISILLSSLALGWTTPREIINSYSGDANGIACGDTLYVISLGTPAFYFLGSWNNGYSWTPAMTPADTFFSGYSEQPDIARDSRGILHTVWKGYEYPSHVYEKIYHLSSTDNGRTWGPRRQRVFNNNTYYVDYPRIIAKGDSLIFICRADSYLIFLRSFDGGLTWQDSMMVDSMAQMSYPPTLLYSQGRLHTIYAEIAYNDSAGIEVYTKHSDDFGLTWSQRIPLSTQEYFPHSVDSQFPSAYADQNGHVVTAWFDYKYGSYCGTSGDILARISTDNGDSWLPESRLTFTQSGEASSCLILGDTIHVVWMDDFPYGCYYPKIEYSMSTNWGNNWSEPEIITGQDVRREQSPFIFSSTFRGESFIHCLVQIPSDYHGTCYLRDKSFFDTHILKPDNNNILSIKAYPSVFNSSAMISIDNEAGGEIQLEIYNILGQRIWKRALNGKEESIIWDAKDDNGNGISSGAYFARATTKDNSSVIKLIYLK